MAVDAMIQTYLMDGDADSFLAKFDKDWIRYNRDPVSYTHLDVYKRQLLYDPAGRICRPLPDHREGFLYDHGSEHGCTEQRSRPGDLSELGSEVTGYI